MGDSPAAILFDVNGNPVGTVIDGIFYRLQVEAKLAPGTNTIGKVDQGAPNSSINAWPVSIQNATMPNIQNLSIETNLEVDGYNIGAGAYLANVTFTTDALLGALELRFSTTGSRNISVSLDDGTVLFSEISNESRIIELDFEDYAIDTGTILTLSISQTGATCLVDITLTSKVSVPVSGVNPVLGVGDNHIGSVFIDTGGKTGTGDAFGRIRVSEGRSLLEVNHQYNLSPRRMGLAQQDVGTTITHSSPLAILAVPAISGRKIVHQSHQYAIYVPGKSQLIRMTGLLDNGTSIAGMGYGDGYDGIFLENYNGTMQIRFLSSTVADQLLTQSQWNLDTLDGNGPSGIILNQLAAQQLIIDLSWLGVGRVRVGLDLNGIIIYMHQFTFSNETTTAYMRTGSLPVRWYLESTGNAATMQAICAAVSSEGGLDGTAIAYAYARITSKTTLAVGVRTPLLSVRAKSIFNSLENHANIIVTSSTFLSSTNDNLLVEVVRNGTLTGASWVSANADSHAEIDEAATAITGGHAIYQDYVSQTTRLLNDILQDELKVLPLTLQADGTSDITTVCVTRIAGAANCYAGINWLEVV